jgi:hypothetical protein
MILVQFIYKTILLLFVLHTTKVTYNNNESSSIVDLSLCCAVPVPDYIWLLNNMASAVLTKTRVRIRILSGNTRRAGFHFVAET